MTNRDPREIAINAQGQLLVLARSTVYIFDTATGGYVSEWSAPGIRSGTGIARGAGGTVFISDGECDSNQDPCPQVQKHAADGTFLASWGTPGTQPDQLRGTSFMGSDPATGELYVPDSGNNRVVRYSANGAILDTWGSAGTGPGQFDVPRGAAIALTVRSTSSTTATTASRSSATGLRRPPIETETVCPTLAISVLT